MKILIVCSKNSGRIAPFITEQVFALQKAGVECSYYTIEGKGIRGYLSNFGLLLKKILVNRPDIIHAHYGLSGLLANLQRIVPVVTTYHGSDINQSKAYKFSKWSIRFSAWNIFVSEKNVRLAGVKKRYSLIPCGVDTDTFYPVDKMMARMEMGLNEHEKLILFAGTFDNQVKNPSLAIDAVKQMEGVRLLELKGYTRQQVAWLMNAVDACLLTSHSEGSPQFIKEALSCNCPVVSVDAGDVKTLMEEVDHCRIVDRNATDIANALQWVMDKNERLTHGRAKIEALELDSQSVAAKIKDIYIKLINK
jgi:teichuronic acid biosynthesis glycosyltransferase TuaC